MSPLGHDPRTQRVLREVLEADREQLAEAIGVVVSASGEAAAWALLLAASDVARAALTAADTANRGESGQRARPDSSGRTGDPP